MIRYEYDQFDQYTKFVDGIAVGTFTINESDPLYLEWANREDDVETVFIQRDIQSPTIPELKQQAVLYLRDQINLFMKQFTERFSDAEVTNFGEQVLQAQDYLKNGPNSYNEPISIEAELTGYTPTRVCQLILGHHELQKRLMPWIRSFRQNSTKLINACTDKTELENVLLNIVPALHGALERNEI